MLLFTSCQPFAAPGDQATPAPSPNPTQLSSLTPTPRSPRTPISSPTSTPTLSPTSTPEDPYEQLLDQYPQIEEYIRLLQASEAMPAEWAITQLQSLTSEFTDSPVAYEAHLTLARYFASIGEAKAYNHYKAALALEKPPSLQLEWARYLESAGRSQEAYSAYRDIFRRFPDESLPALLRLASDPIALATDLLTFGFAEEALAALPDRMDSTPVLSLRAAALIALGRVEEGLAAYDAWLAIDPGSTDAQLGKAGALARLGRNDEALALYAAIGTTGAKLAQGDLLQSLDRKTEALELYLEISDPVAWWRAAGILEEQGKSGEALPFYEKVASSSSILADDASYRLWVLANRVGDAPRASLAQGILEGLWPNYYTLLVWGTGFSLETAPDLPTPAGALPVLDRAQVLDRLGYPQWAISELVYAARATDDPAMDLALGQALYERGAYREAYRIGAAILARKDSSLWTLLAWRLAYPEAYPEAVEASAAEFDLDPLVIWSVMRQESNFYPEAVSVSYAQGLMQVIPSTRDLIAKALDTSAGPESLFNPATSIRFGAYYLGEMSHRFGGDVEYIVAAYNGGPTTVQRTLDHPAVASKDDFYRWLLKGQAREFVNRVMLNYAVYRWLQEVAS